MLWELISTTVPRSRCVALALLSLPVVVASGAAPKSLHRIMLTDVTRETGIQFVHTDGSHGKRYIIENMTAGLALFDFDTDGDIDIYFLNGSATRGATSVDAPPQNALYRNDGDWHFTDVTHAAGVGDRGFGLGVAVADYDNDGDQDLYVTNYGPNVLYQNQGDGTFIDVTDKAGVGGGREMGAGACFLDIEGDGDLDLFCTNYVDFHYGNHVAPTVHGYPQYAGPKDYEPVTDMLFRNNGNGTFTDITDAAGIGEHRGSGMGAICLDYDHDGDSDILVANDVSANFLYENDGTGKFKEVGTLVGVGYNVDGRELGSMGVDCGDLNNDGWLDLIQTSYAGELPALYLNTGIGFFDDVARSWGAGSSTFPHVNWGVAIADLDNDGWRDVLIANGHLQDNVQEYDDSTAFAVANTLLQNTGEGRFRDVSARGGSGLQIARSSRGAGVDDLDGDGLPDLVVLNSRQAPTVLRNDTKSDHGWLTVKLVGTLANRDAVGAQVRVVTGDRSQVVEVHSGRGYQSHYGTTLHFGLARVPLIDKIVIRWPGGGMDEYTNIAAGRTIVLKQRRKSAEGVTQRAKSSQE